MMPRVTRGFAKVEFGSDDSIARVLVGLIDHENTDPGAVLYGNADLAACLTADHALRESGNGVVGRHFRSWPRSSYWLNAQESAVLYESLVDYAVRGSVCDTAQDVHTGYAGDFCDCERRGCAWLWADSIARHAAGIELVATEETDMGGQLLMCVFDVRDSGVIVWLPEHAARVLVACDLWWDYARTIDGGH